MAVQFMSTPSKHPSGWGLLLKIVIITVVIPVLFSLLVKWVAGV
jgi:hypothetical protein